MKMASLLKSLANIIMFWGYSSQNKSVNKFNQVEHLNIQTYLIILMSLFFF